MYMNDNLAISTPQTAVADSGVRMGAGVEPVFETTRAIHIGLKVAQEVRRGGG